MKNITKISLLLVAAGFFASCSVFKRSPKEGCPSDGRNVGAEKVLENLDSKKKPAKWRGGN